MKKTKTNTTAPESSTVQEGNNSQDNAKKPENAKKGIRKYLPTIILFVVFFAGLCILLYPTVSNWWNSRHVSRVIANYNAAIENAGEDDFIRWKQEADDFNVRLLTKPSRFLLSEALLAEYNSCLNVGGTGTMGSIEIPTLSISLPIMHGTNESVLSTAVGHLEGSSLPVGGIGTHCVLTGHRGLPSAKLFTDIDKLMIGGVFLLHVLNGTLAYEVDQILIVLPSQMDALSINSEKDYCTLITCTPYGVNSHRLLIRGHRIEYDEQMQTILKVTPDAVKVDPLLVAPIIAAPVLLVLLIWLMFSTSGGKKKKKVKNKNGGVGNDKK